MTKENTFKTNVPHFITENNDQIIYPFSPPIFQTELDNEFINELLVEAKKLKMEDSYSHQLAGNLKTGRSYIYKDDFILKVEPKIVKQAENFFEGLYQSHGSEYQGVEKTLKKQMGRRGYTNGDLRLDTLWVNFQQKHDFNPPHNHAGVMSFVIYLSVDEKIFKEQADTNSPDAGKIIFEFGDQISELSGTQYPVFPYKGLMFMFPAKLNHYVPPYWIDSERISVSGNLIVT